MVTGSIHNGQGKNSPNPYTLDFMETEESNTIYTIGGDVPMLYKKSVFSFFISSFLIIYLARGETNCSMIQMLSIKVLLTRDQ